MWEAILQGWQKSPKLRKIRAELLHPDYGQLQFPYSLLVLGINGSPIRTRRTRFLAPGSIMRQKGFPSGFCEHENSKGIISPLFTITSFACEDHIPRNMKARSQAVHSVWMLDDNVAFGKFG
jgi:hypothetical protein